MRPAPQESVIMASGSPNVGAAGGGGGGIKPQLVSNQMSHSIMKKSKMFQKLCDWFHKFFCPSVLVIFISHL